MNSQRSMTRRQFVKRMGAAAAGAALGPLVGKNVFAQTPFNTSVRGQVQFWHVWDGSRFALAEDQVASFMRQYPNTRVEHTLLANQGINQKYLTAILGGSPPNVIMVRGGEMPSLAGRNGLRPIDDLIRRDGLDTDSVFYKSEFDSQIFNGKTYGLPLIVGGARFMLFYNKKLFRDHGLDPENPPKTWQELLDVSKKLTIHRNGEIDVLGFNPFASGAFPPSTPFRLWLYTNNGRFYDNEGRNVAFNSKEGLEALEWLVEFIDQVAGKYENIRGVSGGDKNSATLAWYNDKLAMINQGNWHFYQLSQEAPDLEYGVSDIPYNGANTEAGPYTPNEGGWGYCIPRGAKDVDAAWEFIKYATAGDGNVPFIVAQQRPSVRRETNQHPALSEGNPYWPVVLQSLENSVFVPFTPVDVRVKEIVNQMEDEVFFKQRTPRSGLDWAAEQVQAVLDDWYSRNG